MYYLFVSSQNCDVLVLIYVYELFSTNRLFSGWFCKGTNDFPFDQIFQKLFQHSHLSTPFLNCECKDRKNFSIHQILAPNLRETESSTSKTLGAKNRPPLPPHWATKRSHFSFAVAKVETISHSTKYIHQEIRKKEDNVLIMSRKYFPIILGSHQEVTH